MDERPHHGEPSSDSKSTESHHFAVDIAMSPGRSLGHVEALATLESIATQLNNIHLSMETLREQRYDDKNELMVYINDLQHTQNEILNFIEGLWQQL